MTDPDTLAMLLAVRADIAAAHQAATRLTAVIEARDRQIADALAATKRLTESVEHLVQLSYERDAEFSQLLERERDADDWWRGEPQDAD